MAKKDLKKNLEKMESSGYFSEDLRVKVGSFSLDHLEESDDSKSSETKETEEEPPAK